MNAKKWLYIGVVVVMVVGLSGCRGRAGKGSGRFGEAVLDDQFSGSGDLMLDDVTLLGERFAYTDVLDLKYENVVFAFDSSQIAAGEQAKIEAVADYMRRQPTVKTIIDGHTCDVGSRDYNMALGERRALAVRAYLVQLGIDPGRIQTRSYGMEQPLHAGVSESARRLNRRAAFVLVQ